MLDPKAENKAKATEGNADSKPTDLHFTLVNFTGSGTLISELLYRPVLLMP